MSTATDATLWQLVRESQRGVLATVKRDGRPQLSNVDYACDAAARLIRISTTADRVKVTNLRRDPRASLHVTTDAGWGWSVGEGTVELSAVAADPHDATVEELIEVYRTIQGEHPDWADYRAAMVADRRLVIRLPVDRLYGLPGD